MILVERSEGKLDGDLLAPPLLLDRDGDLKRTPERDTIGFARICSHAMHAHCAQLAGKK